MPVSAVIVVISWCCTMLSTSVFSMTYSPKDVIKDYCSGEKFRPSCSHDEVISMTKAVYGRMKLGRCVQIDMGHLGCQVDVLDLADKLCSGRRSCEILIPEHTFELTKPCLELMSYLEASYTCIKVQAVDAVDCEKPVRARVPTGRIASITTNESRCVNAYDTTWLIQGLPGQRINISLLDFNAATTHRRRTPGSDDERYDMSSSAGDLCYKYATITEPPEYWSQPAATDQYQRPPQQYRIELGQHSHPHQQQLYGDHTRLPFTDRPTPVCGRRSRLQHVYSSSSHVVQVKLEWQRASPNYFVIHYEVFGCRDPSLQPTMWLQRISDSEVSVGCRNSATATKWRLVCGADNEWIGDIGNCTLYDSLEINVQRSTSIETTNNAGLLTAVLCMCAFFIAVLVIVTGVIFHRRRRRRNVGRFNSSGKSGSGGTYDVTMRGRTTPKSDYGGVLEDYEDDHGVSSDMAYVYPSRSRNGDRGGSSSRHQRSSGGSESGDRSEAYDIVDGAIKPNKSTSDGPYEKVSSSRYVHIWEMPLPKAPDE